MPYADLIPSIVFGFVMISALGILAVYAVMIGTRIGDALREHDKESAEAKDPRS